MRGWREAIALVALVVLGACGRFDFEQRVDGSLAPDGVVDVGTDAAPRCNWVGGPHLGTVQAHPELSSPEQETDPFLMRGDPLTIHFTSKRDGTYDVFEAHRPAVGAVFDPPIKRPDFASSTSGEGGLVLDAGGTHGWVSIDLASNGTVDFYEVAGTAGALTVTRRVDELDDSLSGLHVDLWPATDELSATFSAGPAGMQQIYSADRSDTASPWTNVQAITLATANSAGATTTADGLVLVYVVMIGAQTDIFYRTRSSTADAWGPETQLVELATTMDEAEPSVRADGCELFFVRGSGTVAPFWEVVSVDITP